MVTACADIARHGLLPAGGKATMLGPAANQAASPHHHHHQQQQQQQLELCPTWSRSQRVGYGLQNLGQTCYLNSVLQCLAHTPPLANLCLDSDFSSGCTLGPTCMACALERQLRAMLARPMGAAAFAALRPTQVVERLGLISRQLRLGRQEDAQEFLRCLVDALERDLLKGAGQWDPRQRIKYPTTLANQLFSGILRSEVHCAACGHTSATYDPFQDLSLELGPGTHSVMAALNAFTEPEQLDGDNSYRCEGCKQLVAAEKKLTIYDEPNVLVIHLKRFNFLHMEKIERHIKFQQGLTLFPFMCSTDEAEYRQQQQQWVGQGPGQQRGVAAGGGGGGGSGVNGWGPPKGAHHHHHHHQQQQQQQEGPASSATSSSSRSHSAAPPDRSTPAHYTLHGVVVHAGHTLNSGHYYAYVKDGVTRPGGGTGQWHRADDSMVQAVTWDKVSSEAAYLLFYVRDTMKPLAPLPPQVETQPGSVPPPAAAAAGGGGGGAGSGGRFGLQQQHQNRQQQQQQQLGRPPLKRPGAMIGPQLPPGHPAAAPGRRSSSSSPSDSSSDSLAAGGGLPKRPKLQQAGDARGDTTHQVAPTAAAAPAGGWKAVAAEPAANGHAPGSGVSPHQQQQQREPIRLDVLGRKVGALPGMNGSSAITKIGGPKTFVRPRPAAAVADSGGGLPRQPQQQQEEPGTGAAAPGPPPQQQQQPPGSVEELKQVLEERLREQPGLGWWQQVKRSLQAAKEAGASLQGVLAGNSEARNLCRRALPVEVRQYAVKTLEGLVKGGGGGDPMQ